MRVLLLLAISYLYILADAHIFVYHRFGDAQHASTNTSLEELEKEFQYFKENNYEVVKVEQIIEKVKKKEEVPSNWVALTIDDSYKSFYENGLPIFKKYNYPFSLAVYVKATQKGYQDFMSWDEVKEASKYGSISLHSYDHPHLTKLSDQEIKEDTQKGIELFQKHLGYKPSIYVYPYGEYNEQVAQAIKSFGFDAILNQNNGSINERSNVQDINRIALVGEVNIKQKLRYNTLDVQWMEPKEYPKDNILKRVVAKVDPKIKNIKLYVTGSTWKDINVKNGIIDEVVNIELKKNRVRVVLSTDYYTVSNKLLIK
ncbi:polysaccharide deacetylase family protein [Candidatus Marinarcus aquaticus]|uniref:Polysaccharide deacetylase n=1 Tax=Candidatus Marinarcus aquaticus TaxID=2044504 RepID=A0A4Q0XSB8_9BACT|nr:polysaccharide deacetylase family protein [Candidatus Marinarcus aquaticus]RXJ58205.1 polysaccharide deacetylase [Candidatus Marinarcus aquaticus]